MEDANDGMIFDAVKQFFTEDNWPFAQMAHEPVLQMAFQGTSGQWMCVAQAREDTQQFINVTTMDRYLPGALSVTYSDTSPANAITQIESSAP